MEKKAYNKPELTVVKLTSMTHLLADSGSESMEGDGGGNAGEGDGSSSSNNSRRASFSTFDGEE